MAVEELAESKKGGDMNQATRPKLVEPKRAPYKPILSERERRAYQTAHRLMTETTDSPELATPGARRSAQMDRIAGIILETMK